MSIAFSIFCMLVLLMYLFYIFSVWMGWRNTPGFVPVNDVAPETRVTVIVPMRNEARNVERLLKSLLAQEYPEPLLEIILVDDGSEDDTVALVQPFLSSRVKLLPTENPDNRLHKKRAVETGVRYAAGELIMTTDADCVHYTRWVFTTVAFYTAFRPAFIAGPVAFAEGKGLIAGFQALEFAPVMMQTAAAIRRNRPLMANGANMAYPREKFLEVGGYSGDAYASGDDVSLLQKMVLRYGTGQVRFLRNADALVSTRPLESWRELIQQRRRWLSKNRGAGNRDAAGTAGLIFLTHLIGWAMIIASFIHVGLWVWAVLFWSIRLLADIILFATYARFCGRRLPIAAMLFSEFIYAGYIAALLPAAWGRTVTWKGRPA